MSNKQIKINQNMKVVDRSYNLRQNILKVNIRNTVKHEVAKLLVLLELVKNGSTIYTECVFCSGHRADVFDPLDNRAYEIVSTETKDSIDKKYKNYPCKITFLNADDVLKSNGFILNDDN